MRLPVEYYGEGLARRDAGEQVARHGASILKMVTRSLQKRVDCDKDNSSPECEKPVSTQTTPIVLGTVIPLVIACGILFFLHRRSKKRQAIEDANDPHKSLDFGVDMPSRPEKSKRKFGKNVPEMTITEVGKDGSSGRRQRGLSMDMNMDSPYLLPAQLQSSRESLHSMSRTVQDQHDPYRPVNMMRTSHDTARGSPRPFTETGSVYSASTMRTGDGSSLLANAQRMSQSQPYPTRGDSMNEDGSSLRQMHSGRSMTPMRKASQNSSEPTLANISEAASKKESLPPLPSPPSQASPEPAQQTPPPRKSSMPSSAMPPRKSSMSAASQGGVDRHNSVTSYYEDDIPPPPPPPKIDEPQIMASTPVVQEPESYDSQYDIDPALIYTGRFSIDNSAPSTQHYPAQDNRMSVMGLRPLPPDDPQENAEQRANRIRSFYKEYFDDSRPGPAQGGYYEDSDYFMDGAIYDPDTGGFITPGAPWAQPMGRRAMTPPPGGAPRFAGADMHRRQYSTMSAGRAAPRGRAPPPKKKLPPPKALNSLPTPHLLRDDTALIHNPIDFAPPTTFRETQNGRRPDSPMGIQRPYSPSVRAYSPLVPAFDELSVIPSPHHLRKSGAFMPLDFAPPSRLKLPGETGSDSGSIRSARSGISAMQMDAVRAGAYRVSRIPKEYVTNKDDMRDQLRPKMDLVSRA